MIVSRWPILDGLKRNGATPKCLFKLPDRSVRIAYSDGTGARFECWACVMQTLRLRLGDGPIRLQAPENFGD